MKKLTLYPRMGPYNFKLIAELFQSELSNEFKEFMTYNAGLGHYERIFKDEEGTSWEVNQYLEFKEMYNLSKEFTSANWGKMLPFAFDPGGWHFCLCLEKEYYGSIFVNRWTDHSREEQFLKIANNFEEFINGLERNPDEI